MMLSTVLSHIIIFHLEEIARFGLMAHFNALIMHFYLFSKEYQIPLESMIDSLGEALLNVQH